MSNKNQPHVHPDKNTTGTNPTDRRTNETPAGANNDNQPATDREHRGVDGTAKDRGNTTHVPNAGRDITTGGTGGDGSNRQFPKAAKADGTVATDDDDASLDETTVDTEVDEEETEEEQKDVEAKA